MSMKLRAAVVAPIALALLISGLPAAPASTASAAAADSAKAQPRLRTAEGTLAGTRLGPAEAFLGVPYAASPTKANRFRPPQPVPAWSGVRDATRQGPACLQFQPTGVRDEQATSEDCLYLDVYRPRGTQRNAKLPVLLWYHGGGWTQGSGVIYGGQTLAARTNSIVVSINYRLGALGFLSLSSLDADLPDTKSGNFATLDQIQALDWVRTNATALGADRNKITIFGQSAGGASVCAVLTSPLARGKVARGIIQSFGCTGLGTMTRTAAHEAGEKFAAAAGCPAGPEQAACLRTAWAPKLVSAAMTSSIAGAVYDTPVLPLSPAVALRTGQWSKVPLVVGTTRHEGRLLTISESGLTADGYAEKVRATYGANADKVLAAYPLSDYATPFHAWAELFGDALLTCPVDTMARTLAPQTRVWRYEFDDPTSPTLYGFQPDGVDMSNAHSAELAYLFDFTLGDKPLAGDQLRLARQMQRYWGAFAWSGDPNASGQRFWPRYTDATEQVLSLRPTGSVVVTGTGADHHCGLWSSLSQP